MSLEDERRAALENIAQLERRIDGHERELHSLETLSDALAAIDKRLDKIDRRLDDGDRRMAEIEKQLAANTAITTSVRDAQIAGRVLSSAVKHMAAFIISCGVIWGAIYGITHHTPIPPGAGK